MITQRNSLDLIITLEYQIEKSILKESHIILDIFEVVLESLKSQDLTQDLILKEFREDQMICTILLVLIEVNPLLTMSGMNQIGLIDQKMCLIPSPQRNLIDNLYSI